jgi:hypothetical protein
LRRRRADGDRRRTQWLRSNDEPQRRRPNDSNESKEVKAEGQRRVVEAERFRKWQERVYKK